MTDDMKDECNGDTCPLTLLNEADTAHKLAVATNVLISVAACGVVAGTILVFVEGRERRGKSALTVVPAATPSGAALSVEGRF
jgi:hypothetical protein